MPPAERIFLTTAEAIDAIAADFGQYGPQPGLLREIAPLILGMDVKTGPASDTLWIRRSRTLPFEPVDHAVLGFYLIHVLETSQTDADTMAQICRLVFETPARPGCAGGEPGVWLDCQMDGFVCIRCGNCCRSLAPLCDAADLERWEKLGRKDILSRVEEERPGSHSYCFRTVLSPDGPRCPFLRREADRFSCAIQDVKPEICREYPLTRKHAAQTGCPGYSTGSEMSQE